MVGHAMKYVGMANRVAEEMGAKITTTAGEPFEVLAVLPYIELGVGGKIVADNLFKAEVALVTAYRSWRDYMTSAAENGSELAKKYLEDTVWDLT